MKRQVFSPFLHKLYSIIPCIETTIYKSTAIKKSVCEGKQTDFFIYRFSNYSNILSKPPVSSTEISSIKVSLQGSKSSGILNFSS